MQLGKILIQEAQAQTVDLLLLRDCQSPAHCFYSFGYDKRFFITFLTFLVAPLAHCEVRLE